MKEEGVHKRAGTVPRSGMDDHVGPLVHHDQVVIFVHNVEGNVLIDRKMMQVCIYRPTA